VGDEHVGAVHERGHHDHAVLRGHHLAAGTIYQYRVVAFNEQGEAPVSATAGVNTAAPTTPRIYSVSASQVRVQIFGVANYASTESMRVQRSTSPTGPFATVATISDAYDQVWTDSSVAANTTYYYRTVSVAGGWTSLPSDTILVTTLTP